MISDQHYNEGSCSFRFLFHKQDYRTLGSDARLSLSNTTLPSAPKKNGIQAMKDIGDFIDRKDARNQ